MDFLLSLLLIPFAAPLVLGFVNMCCCGPVDCNIFADTFTRANLDSDWSVEAGTAVITSNQLDPATNTVVVVVQDHPDLSGTGKWQIGISGLASGDIIRIIFAYVDTSNYFFGELVFTASNNWSMAIYERASGTNTALTPVVPQTFSVTPNRLLICAYDDHVTFTAGQGTATTDRTIVHSGATLTGTQVGLGTGGTLGSGFRFDNADWDHNEATQPTCPCRTCACDICSGTTPCEMQIEMSGVSDGTCSDCETFNAVFIFPLSFVSSPSGTCQWLYYPTACPTQSPLAFIYQEFVPGSYNTEFGVPGTIASEPTTGSEQDCATWDIELNVSPSGLNAICDWRSVAIFATPNPLP